MVNPNTNIAKFHQKRFTRTIIAACLAVAIAAPAAQAQSKQKHKVKAKNNKPSIVWTAPTRRREVTKPAKLRVRSSIVAPRRRTVNQRIVYRRYGPSIYGYGFHYTDAEAARWLAFTSLSLSLIDQLQEPQVRYYEQSQIDATNAPIGETIIWSDGDANGSTTAIREGRDANGYTCREFQQTISINGNFEEAYGTACLQPNGNWQIVS